MPRANYRNNFVTLCLAIQNREAALLECQAETGQKLMLICATNRTANGMIEFVPLARLLDEPLGDLAFPTTLLPPELNPEIN